MEVRTSIDVAASTNHVWEVLVDFERWPEWTDSVSSVRPLDAGPLAVGSRVEISQPRLPTATYTVTALEPRRAFTWEQQQPGSRVSAHHECAPLPDGGTRVELRVVMSGLLGSIMGRLYRRLTERYLAMEAAGLKSRAEGIAH
ncbi:SRPBCC family protein [Nocardioides dilutus]